MQGIYGNALCYSCIFGYSSQQLQRLAQALDNVVISKTEIGWDLTELETAAKLVSLTI